MQRVTTGMRQAVCDGPLWVDCVNAKDNAGHFGTKLLKLESMSRCTNQRPKTMGDIVAALRT